MRYFHIVDHSLIYCHLFFVVFLHWEMFWFIVSPSREFLVLMDVQFHWLEWGDEYRIKNKRIWRLLTCLIDVVWTLSEPHRYITNIAHINIYISVSPFGSAFLINLPLMFVSLCAYVYVSHILTGACFRLGTFVRPHFVVQFLN